MKLLFDQNLSHKLKNTLADLFPGSIHVREIGLQSSQDDEVWQYAKVNGFTIVTKDADFIDISLLNGFPPRLIWIRIGNSTTGSIAELLRKHGEKIKEMESEEGLGILTLD